MYTNFLGLTLWWTLSIIWCTPTHYMMDPCPSYDGPQTVPNQKVMNNSAIQWRIKKIISQHSLNSNSLIHRLLKTRDIANLSKKGIHHIMYPIHHMMYPYPAYDVPLSIIWCTPIHHMLHPVHHMMEELKNIYCFMVFWWKFVFYFLIFGHFLILLGKNLTNCLTLLHLITLTTNCVLGESLISIA